VASTAETAGSVTGFGKYAGLDAVWRSGTGVRATTSFRCFAWGMVQFELTVPRGLSNTNATAVGANGPVEPAAPPVTEFPSFSAADAYLGGRFRHLTHAGPWTLSEWWGTGNPNGPLGGRGPLYLVDPAYSGSNGSLPTVPTVAVLAPGNHFVGQQWLIDRTLASPRLSLGALSTVTIIPAGFTTSAVIWSGTRGLTTETFAWGELMQAASQTRRIPRSLDLVRDTISAWTDNGRAEQQGSRSRGATAGPGRPALRPHPCPAPRPSALPRSAVHFQSYWGTRRPTRNCTAVGNTTAEATLRAWHACFREAGVPVGISQLDTWWFLQGADVGSSAGGIDCADRWPREDLFPSGLRNLMSSFPLLLNAWGFLRPEDGQRITNYMWEAQLLTGTASTQDKAMVVLDEVEAFYSETRDRFLALGGTSFEQDNVFQKTQDFEHSLNITDGAERWFHGFATPFCESGIRVQVCEASPADVMETLRYGCVTNSKDNIDDVPGNHAATFVERWHVGFDRMLLGALGLSPFFDNVWAMPTQPGSTWAGAVEPYLELAWALSILGAGPVGVGDMANNTNVTLAATAYAADGTLLNPSRPSTYIDDVYQDPSSAPFNVTAGRVFQAPAFVGAGASKARDGPGLRAPGDAPAGTSTYFSVLAVDVDAQYNLPLGQLAPRQSAEGFLAVPWTPGLGPTSDVRCRSGAALAGCAVLVNGSQPLSLRTGLPSHEWGHSFELCSLSPLECGQEPSLVLLGELGAMVRVSASRFSAVAVQCGAQGQLTAELRGKPGEAVDLAVAWTGKAASVGRFSAVIGPAGSVGVVCRLPRSGEPTPACQLAHE